MAATYIGTSSVEQLRNELRRDVSHTDDSLEGLTSTAAKMLTMLTNNPPTQASDYTMIESKYGLAAGTGEAVYTLVKNARDRITHANVRDLVERLG